MTMPQTTMAQTMMRRTRSQSFTVRMVFALALLMTSMPGLALAQATGPATDAKPAKAPTSKAATPAASASASDGGLKARVESLEEQLVDMQVVVGTLESLSKSGANSSSQVYSGASTSADGSRVDVLESQIRNLQTQVQQLSDQVRSLGGTPRRTDLAPLGGVAGAGVAAVGGTQPRPGTSAGTPVRQSSDDIAGLIDGKSTTSSGTDLPPIPIENGQPTAGGSTGIIPGAPGAPPVTTAALPPSTETSDPKQLYETAYGYLLQRDYGAAEVAFDEFLRRFPQDSLSGNAQYWLGESFFVRGQYKSAASAFLKGYQTYAQSSKAPDSLLKLAMSLDKLGQKDAACSSFAELQTKFPNAPQGVKSRVQSERQRIACP